MKYLLDTAVWINAVTLPHVLPARIRRLLEDSGPKGLSSISLLETAILHRLRRFNYDGDLKHFFSVALSSDLQIVELTPSIASGTNKLSPEFQGDPFDRTIVATAVDMHLTLITSDSGIRDAGDCKIEYCPFKPSRTAGR